MDFFCKYQQHQYFFNNIQQGFAILILVTVMGLHSVKACITQTNLINTRPLLQQLSPPLRISHNGELKELEEGVKGKSQQLEKNLRP